METTTETQRERISRALANFKTLGTLEQAKYMQEMCYVIPFSHYNYPELMVISFLRWLNVQKQYREMYLDDFAPNQTKSKLNSP